MYLCYSIVSHKPEMPKDLGHIRNLKDKLETARKEYNNLANILMNDPLRKSFQQKQSELENARNNYLNLPNVKAIKLKQLNDQLKERQLSNYLSHHRLVDVSIKGIGDGRLAMLLSYGIETADDIDYEKVDAIPGFGSSLSISLLEWKDSIQRSFVYNHSCGVDPSDIDSIDIKIHASRLQLEKMLCNGPDELRRINNQIEANIQTTTKQIELSAKNIAQAEADLSAL